MTTIAPAPMAPSDDHTHHQVLVAMTGNPNTGKSALFNRLTGSRQRVGNFPGLTVEKRLGQMKHGHEMVPIVDLPGLYSLEALSPDEWVVHHVLHGQAKGMAKPDLVICVLDASNLKRNLYLATQVAHANLPVVIALNMMDEAGRKGLRIDHEALSQRLGVPVIPTAATSGQGIDALKQAIVGALGQPAVMRAPAADVTPAARYAWIDEVLDGVVDHRPAPPSRRESIDQLLTHRVFGLAVFLGVMYVIFTAIYTLAAPLMDVIDWTFGSLSGMTDAWLEGMPVLQSLVGDGIIAGVGGVVIFLPQIVILFFFIALLEDTGYMARAAFLMDRLFSWCGLSGKSFVPLLSSYACAIPGIMAARTIDDTRARLTTMLIAPLMSCSARLPVYVLLIGVFIEPRFGPWWAGFALFVMHLLGLAVAMPTAWIINRLLLRGQGTPFVLEMPPYRIPAMRDVLWRMFERAREFLIRAGTVIFAMSIVIWAMCYFPRPASVEESIENQLVAQIQAHDNLGEQEARTLLANDEELTLLRDHRVDSAYLEQSYMGRLGRLVQPAFAPAGFDWKITVSVLASFPAREVLISTLGIVYGIGGEVDEGDSSLHASMQRATHADGSTVYTLPVVIGVMVFFALCLQCASTVAIIARESHWKWAILAFTYMTILAWIGAVASYQIGSLFT